MTVYSTVSVSSILIISLIQKDTCLEIVGKVNMYGLNDIPNDIKILGCDKGTIVYVRESSKRYCVEG